MARNLQQQEAFDQILMQLAAQHNGIESLLKTIFSFFHRKTDLYVVANKQQNNMGFPPGVAEKLVLRAFHEFQTKDISSIKLKAGQGRKIDSKDPHLVELEHPDIEVNELKQQSRKAKMAKAKKKKAIIKASTTTTTTTPNTTGKIDNNNKETIITSSLSSTTINDDDNNNNSNKKTSLSNTTGNANDDVGPKIKYTKEGKQIPIGNGGICDKYFWTQSLYETTVYIDVPEGTRGKDIDCKITASKLSLRLKGQKEYLINGELDAKVKTDSMWTIDDRKTVVITLDKCVETWWGTVIKGDPEIDTQRVDSTKKVSDYDDETQGAIRKIMFDQNQKHLGLPTSDEMKSNAILEKARYAPGSPFLPPEERNKGLPPPAVE